MKVRKFSLVVACIGATLLASCGKSGGGMPNFGDNEFAVRTITSSNAALQTTYPATIKGIQDVEVRPKVSGFITKVLVHEGQTVAAGQVLFTIDSETYAAAVRQARAAVNTAKAQLSTAKLTMDNNKKLYDKAIIGQYEYTSSANSYATAQAQLAQAEAALAAAREQLAWCSVKSPAAGVVGSLPFKAGALVSASGQALTTVSDISTVEVFFSVSESELLALSKTNGSTQAAIASFPELKLKLADGSIYNHPGKVVKMSGVLDATTGSVSLIAHFANPDKLLKSGGAGTIIGALSRMGIVVSMRLHALIFAAGQGIPLAGVVYDPKVSAFLRYIGQEQFVDLDALTEESLRQMIDHCAAQSSHPEAQAEAVKRLREMEQRNVMTARRLLGM